MNLTQLQLQNSIGDVDYGTLRLDGNDITVSGVVFDALSDGECCLSPTKMLAEIFFQPRHHSAVLALQCLYIGRHLFCHDSHSELDLRRGKCSMCPKITNS
eukprot:scaffold93005_cov17-Tisochrysis_lutea.AAC.3